MNFEQKGAFSRSIGCELGAAKFQGNDLIFFVDVDMSFNQEFLFRARLNTIQYKQVYYPIVYSEYNPDKISEALKIKGKFFRVILNLTCQMVEIMHIIFFMKKFSYFVNKIYEK